MSKQRKPYNPNTAYGRKKLREQAAENYANMTPQERAEVDSYKFWIWFIIIVIILIIGFATGNWMGVLKWATNS